MTTLSKPLSRALSYKVTALIELMLLLPGADGGEEDGAELLGFAGADAGDQEELRNQMMRCK